MSTNETNPGAPIMVRTDLARLAYPAIFEPRPKMKGEQNAKLYFQATLLFPPTTDMRPIVQAISDCMVRDWGAAKKLTGKANPLKACTSLNAARALEGKKPWKGFDDGWYALRCLSQYAPAVVDENVKPVYDPLATSGTAVRTIKEAEEKVYPGCWCHFVISPYTWSYAGTDGVGFNCRAVQFVKHGERIDAQGFDVATHFQPVKVTAAPTNTASGDALADLLG